MLCKLPPFLRAGLPRILEDVHFVGQNAYREICISRDVAHHLVNFREDRKSRLIANIIHEDEGSDCLLPVFDAFHVWVQGVDSIDLDEFEETSMVVDSFDTVVTDADGVFVPLWEMILAKLGVSDMHKSGIIWDVGGTSTCDDPKQLTRVIKAVFPAPGMPQTKTWNSPSPDSMSSVRGFAVFGVPKLATDVFGVASEDEYKTIAYHGRTCLCRMLSLNHCEKPRSRDRDCVKKRCRLGRGKMHG